MEITIAEEAHVPEEVKDKIFPETTILSAYRGSIAHGMFIPSTDPNSIDDVDIMSVVVPSLDNYFGLGTFGSRGTQEYWYEKFDTVSYELLKFVSLLVKGNPNVLSLLYVPEEMYLKRTKAGQLLIHCRKIFMTKQLYKSFVGYAHGQSKKMTATEHKGYMGKKRGELVEQFGYDTKNAAHLIRILRMGIEALQTGVMQVYRTKDAEELLSIKRGEFTLDEVKTEATRLFSKAESVIKYCTLPEVPDYDKVNLLCKSILSNSLVEELK